MGGYLATKLSRNSEDVISTVKITSAMLLPAYLAGIGADLLSVAWFLLRRLYLSLCYRFLRLCSHSFFEELDRSLGGLRHQLSFSCDEDSLCGGS